jgi:hypothetical protein
MKMALKVIKERSTGMYLAGDFSEVAFADAERVADKNDAAWLWTFSDQDCDIIASVELVGDQFEVIDVSGREPS